MIILCSVVLVAISTGYWAWSEKSTPVEDVNTVRDGDVPQDEQFSVPQTETYTSQRYGFSFNYPKELVVTSARTRKILMQWDTETVPLPADSIEIPGHVIISIIPYSELSKEKPIYDYESCCTGTRYWFDSIKRQWQANKIRAGQYDENGNNIPDPLTPLPLSSNGVCTLEQKFGPNIFYKIESGDEGVPTDVYYFLPTNQGYAIRFLTSHDVRGDYSSYAEESHPDPAVMEIIARILTSVTLTGNTTSIQASCL